VYVRVVRTHVHTKIRGDDKRGGGEIPYIGLQCTIVKSKVYLVRYI